MVMVMMVIVSSAGNAPAGKTNSILPSNELMLPPLAGIILLAKPPEGNPTEVAKPGLLPFGLPLLFPPLLLLLLLLLLDIEYKN
jgi:hypothetical protein